MLPRSACGGSWAHTHPPPDCHGDWPDTGTRNPNAGQRGGTEEPLQNAPLPRARPDLTGLGAPYSQRAQTAGWGRGRSWLRDTVLFGLLGISVVRNPETSHKNRCLGRPGHRENGDRDTWGRAVASAGPPGTPRQQGSLTPAPPRPPCWRTAPSILPCCCVLGPSQALLRPAGAAGGGGWALGRPTGGETSQTADGGKLSFFKRKFQSPPQHNSESTFQSERVLGHSLARCLCSLMISQPGGRGAGGTVAEDRIRSPAARARSQPASHTGQ